MNCDDAQPYLIDYVDHPEQVPPAVGNHIKDCSDCGEAMASIRGMNALWEEERQTLRTPGPLRTTVRDTIRDELTDSIGVVKLVLAFLVGLGMAGMALQSLPAVESTGWVASCGLWWGGLFVIGSTLMVGGIKLSNGWTSTVAGISTVSAGIVFGGIFLCPGVHGMTGLAEAGGLRSFLHVLAGPVGSYLLVGLLYALVPTAVVTIVVAPNLPDHWGRASVFAGVGFLLLMAPMVYVECTLLSPLGAVFLLLGLIIGSVGGPLGGLFLRYHAPAFR